MKKMYILLLALCLLLGGCGQIFDGSYASITPHQVRTSSAEPESTPVRDYNELQAMLAQLVNRGLETRTIYTQDYDLDRLEREVNRAIEYITDRHPIGAYAVESVSYELGTSAGQTVVAVDIAYLRSRVEILQIKTVADMSAAKESIYEALDACDPGMVLQITAFEPEDFALIVEKYAAEHPDMVMEIPQVTVNTYPENGDTRVVELAFSYQTSRESLRSMQEQVRPLFYSAAMYVSEDASDFVKYSQLYTFLMERFDYQIATSITPAYSLLRHGVGDSEAFATVYAAICRRAGLECLVVSGTRDGEAHYWNIVCDSTEYYHVDLLRCQAEGGYTERFDNQMSGYVWDYEAYPACVPAEYPVPPEERPTEPPTEAPTEAPAGPSTAESTEPAG